MEATGCFGALGSTVTCWSREGSSWPREGKTPLQDRQGLLLWGSPGVQVGLSATEADGPQLSREGWGRERALQGNWGSSSHLLKG